MDGDAIGEARLRISRPSREFIDKLEKHKGRAEEKRYQEKIKGKEGVMALRGVPLQAIGHPWTLPCASGLRPVQPEFTAISHYPGQL